MHPARPARLFLQNHWGLYRSDDGSENWTDIANGVPSDFGFAMVMHPRNPDCVYIVPVESDQFRCACDGRLRVYRTRSETGRTRRRSEEHTSELQSRLHLVCRLLLEKKIPAKRRCAASCCPWAASRRRCSQRTVAAFVASSFRRVSRRISSTSRRTCATQSTSWSPSA